jgi:CRISPR/Cas system endoribonuclease Cas6 (RAMP superfamily)
VNPGAAFQACRVRLHASAVQLGDAFHEREANAESALPTRRHLFSHLLEHVKDRLQKLGPPIWVEEIRTHVISGLRKAGVPE